MKMHNNFENAENITAFFSRDYSLLLLVIKASTVISIFTSSPSIL